MASTNLEVESLAATGSMVRPKKVVNDFTIQVATVNGSGSQSANSILLRSIFRMGVPVSGKNLFPSNIAGLPTWYLIRASRDGWVARKGHVDLLIALNPETVLEDIHKLPAGGAVIHDETFQLGDRRDDVVYYSVPFDQLVVATGAEAKVRKLIKNMIYVGVAAQLLAIDMKGLETIIRQQFSKKAAVADLNWKAVQLGFDYAANSLTKQDGLTIEPMNATQGKIIIDGNSACALGAMFAGVTVVAWYPITPATSLAEDLIKYMKKHRVEKDGKATFAIVQAEDELAAIGMVLGAGWGGARAMTSTSGPGISLMAEFAGLGYFAEIPGVIFDVQRTGPSTGLPTRTQQCDIAFVSGLSHGDTKQVMLLPGSVRECFEHAIEAFDLAEMLQTPVFVLSDLDMGMNNWMSDPFEYPKKPINRGKVLDARQLEELGGFARYKDVDGDAIPYRTLPGTNHPKAAYFTRGTGRNEKAQYSERPEDYVANMERLVRKFETAKTMVPKPVLNGTGQEKIGIIAFGSSDPAVLESQDQLRREAGIETDYLRLRAYPFSQEVNDFVAQHETIYVVEQNRDGQMMNLLKTDLDAFEAPKLRPVRYFAGLPIEARVITEAITTYEGEQK